MEATTSASDGTLPPDNADDNAHLYPSGEEPPQNDGDPNNPKHTEKTPISYLALFTFGLLSTPMDGKPGYGDDEYNPDDCLFSDEVPPQPLGENVGGYNLPEKRWTIWKAWDWTKNAFSKLTPYWQKAMGNPKPAIQFIVRCINTKIVLRVASCFSGGSTANPREDSLVALLGGDNRKYSGISPDEERKVRGTWSVSKFLGTMKELFGYHEEAKKNEAQWLESKEAADEWTREHNPAVADNAFLVYDNNSGEAITDTTPPLNVYTCIDDLRMAIPKGVGNYRDAQGNNHPLLPDFTEENNYTFEMKVRGHGVSIKAVSLDGDEHNKWKDRDTRAWDTLAEQLAKKKRKKCPLCPKVLPPANLVQHFSREHGEKLKDWLAAEDGRELVWTE